MLKHCSSSDFPVRERSRSSYESLKTFSLPKASQRKYTTQFADLYFARLALLKRHVESVAEAAWSDFQVFYSNYFASYRSLNQLGGETVRRVERVLDVRQGDLCWVVGTVFMDMPMKPNILDDLTKEVFAFNFQ
jgi:DNA polymerase delta subunit 2